MSNRSIEKLASSLRGHCVLLLILGVTVGLRWNLLDSLTPVGETRAGSSVHESAPAPNAQLRHAEETGPGESAIQ